MGIVGMVVFICTRTVLKLLGLNRAAFRVLVKEWIDNLDGDVLRDVWCKIAILLCEGIAGLGAEIAQERWVVDGIGVASKRRKKGVVHYGSTKCCLIADAELKGIPKVIMALNRGLSRC